MAKNNSHDIIELSRIKTILDLVNIKYVEEQQRNKEIDDKSMFMASVWG